MCHTPGHGLNPLGRRSIFIAAPLLLFIFLFQGCISTSGPSSGFNIISVSQEITMGRRLSVQVEKKFPIYPSREARLYVTYLGDRLVRAYGGGRPMFDFTFKVVDDKEVNAFNIPGGYIYIHRGLISKADNEAELASVVAHEIGHALARHSTQMMSTQMGVSLVLSMVLGQDPSQLEQIAAGLFTNAGILAYTRSMEREADRLAVFIMYRAGYDPRASVTFMEKLLALKKSEPGALGKLFSSHPPTAERIRNVEAEIAMLTLRKGLFLNTSRFDLVKKMVEADPYPTARNSPRY